MEDDEPRPVFDRLDGIPVPAESRSLIGHADALDQLTQAHHRDRLHHAWLLAGPKGIGKSTLALGFAKHLFSHPQGRAAPSRFEPDSISEAVHGSVAQGAHAQLLHLTRPWDAKGGKFKTRLSIDEVRRTVNFYGMTAGGGGWRVTIVDAADDMNVEAANALLKMLEEPPSRSIFLVVTHAPGSLLPTIRSRCRVLPMSPLSADQMGDVLRAVGPTDVPETAANRAAALAQGSPRRALQLLGGDVLARYDSFEAMMAKRPSGGATAWVDAHKLADALSARGADATFELFIELVLDWLAARVREGAAAGEGWLDRWAALHGETRAAVATAASYNLDRKQLLLNLFAALFSLAAS